MSYEIYKSIKQLPDNSFKCVSASSNCSTWDGKRDFREFTMTYFKDNWPTASSQEARALWLVYSGYCGDKFYPSNWKADQRLANRFMREKGYNMSDMLKDHDLWLERAREFIAYKASYSQQPKECYIVKMQGRYVTKLTRCKAQMCVSRDDAKVFKSTLDDLQQKFNGYSQYSPEYISI